MRLTVNGTVVNVATGGKPHSAGQPFAVLIHGAGLDHTTWALQSRWLAFHGWNVLAVDLPGHGTSVGAPLTSIRASADWLVALLDVAGAASASLIGHSMGALIALETAAVAPTRVSHLVLIGAAATMPVHPDLLAAAAANDHAAIDMVNIWGFGFRAGLGANRAPGVWMAGVGERLLEKSSPGVLSADLSACNDYGNGLEAAATVGAPSLVICGERDQMTPLKNARVLASALPKGALLVVPGAGHMLTTECPDEVLTALSRHLKGG